jgi:glucan 1,3-beta-glucosidase
VADHSLDNPDADPPQNIAVGRGALIESKSPTWLVGTSFEHCTLYQYALHGAENLYIGQHQTENPYWQGKGTARLAPEPWAVNASWGDPGFENCEEGDYACRRAWGLYVNQTRDTIIHGSAMWSFFNAMDDNLWSDPQCTLTDGICQTNMAYVEGATEMWWFSVSSKSTENLVVDAGGGTGGSGNGSAVVTTQRDNPGSWGAVVAAYLRNAGTVSGDGEKDEDSGTGRVVLSGLTLAAVVVGILHQLLLAV